jgi:large subunit ribosomal protein L32
MAVPRARISKQRRNKRRSAHWKLALPGLSPCPKCGAPVQSHRACRACGTYKGRVVLAVKED